MPLTSHPHYLQKGPLDLIETGQGLKVQTDKPHLVSLGSGRLSTAITLLPLEEGELRAGRTRLLPALFIHIENVHAALGQISLQQGSVVGGNNELVLNLIG